MWRYRLRKVLSLSWRELRELVAAQWALVTALVIVRTRPKGQLVHAHLGSAPEITSPATAGLAAAQRLSLAVQRAGEHGLFRPTCLVRSVALERMLRRRGFHSARIHIGVQPGEDVLQAHAWVEYGGMVLGDHPHHVRRFEPFGSVNVMPR